MRRESSKLTILLLTLTLCSAGAAVAASGGIHVDASQVSWDTAPGYRLTLSISGPGDLHHRQDFAPGEAPRFDAFSESGDLLADGVYTWELTAVPAKTAKRSASEALSAVKGFVHSGSFSLAGGAFVDPRVPEEVGGSSAVVGGSLDKDQQILDDLIVDGSLCVGFDCVNGESFGFDTIRMKENNVRLRCFDTSSTASFPSNDWQLTCNDTSNGGQNKFSIDDIDGGRTPFTIEASAPSHSLYVDDGGRIGLGTSTPVVQLHVKDGNTPTLRLEQDGTSGFSPQTWDVAGNEANFFVRDASNGSTLPFRIFPGAPSDALTIEASTGDVGMGTTTPDAELDIENISNPAMRLTNSSSNVWEIVSANTSGRLNFANITSGNTPLKIDDLANNNLLRLGLDGLPDQVDITGNLVISGTCSANGGACDGVFSSDYPLPSIEDHAAFMWDNSYLPGVGPTPDGPTRINVFQKTAGILNELEKAHIYIEQLHGSIRDLQSRLDKLEATEEE